MNVDNKVTVITGGARGLGLAYATALAKRGGRVVLGDAGADRSGEGANANVVQQAAKALQQLGYQARSPGGIFARG